jgi:hypothetical protein
MFDILVFAFLVSCGPDLLICSEIDGHDQSFEDMTQCEMRLGQIVEHHQYLTGDSQIIMGRCRYLMPHQRWPRSIEDRRYAKIR